MKFKTELNINMEQIDNKAFEIIKNNIDEIFD